MAIREIRLFGDPVLKSPTRPVTDYSKVRQLVADLMETTALPGRAGVAANQIGAGLRVVAYHVNRELGDLINPEIIALSGEPSMVEEGCLSVPGLWHPVSRYPEAIARGYLLDGTQVEVAGSGLLAQALQHETDHLDGKLYLDRLDLEERRKAFKLLRQQPWFSNIDRTAE